MIWKVLDSAPLRRNQENTVATGFNESFQHPKHSEKSKRDQQVTTSLGLRGIPRFIVNGKVVFGMNETTLRALIDVALRVQSVRVESTFLTLEGMQRTEVFAADGNI